jgi:organic radical activating enzyme
MPTSAALPEGFSSDKSNAVPEYRVKAIFPTIQGEGFWAGTHAVFVRLTGCNMWSGYEEDRERDARRNTAGDDPYGCPMWCDTDFRPEGSESMKAREIGDEIERLGVPPVAVFTGGEPLLQLDSEIFFRLHERFPDLCINVETNGTQPLEGVFGAVSHEDPATPDWVCCSPKVAQRQILIEKVDEAKLVVPDFHPKDYWSLEEKCRERMTPMGPQKHLYVQPEDGPRFDEACEIVKDVTTSREGWRASTQSHKTLGAE